MMKQSLLRKCLRTAKYLLVAVCALLLTAPTGQLRTRAVPQEERTDPLTEEIAHSNSASISLREGLPKKRDSQAHRRTDGLLAGRRVAADVLRANGGLPPDRAALNGCGAPLLC